MKQESNKMLSELNDQKYGKIHDIDDLDTIANPANEIIKFGAVKGENGAMNSNEQKSNEPVVYILPTHYSMTISNVNYIDIENTKADVNAVLTIAVFYGKLMEEDVFINPGKQAEMDKKEDKQANKHPKEPEKHIGKKTDKKGDKKDQQSQWPQKLRQMMIVQLSHKQNINLNDKDVQFFHRTQKKMLLFRIRKDFGAILCEDVCCTPFENLYLVFSIRIQDINLSPDEKQENRWMVNKLIKIKFNFLKFQVNSCLSPQNMGTQIYFTDQLNIGEYEVSRKKTYSDSSIYRFPYQIADRMKLKSLSNYKDEGVKNKTKNIIKKRQEIIKVSEQIINFQKSLQNEPIFTFPEYEQQNKALLDIVSHPQELKQSHENKDRSSLQDEQDRTDKKNHNRYKIRSFNYSHISITLFHHPTVTVLTTLFPLITIAFVNLACYSINPSQDEWDVKKLTAIVTAIVAYIGLIPVVRKQIPPTENPTIIEVMVFIELLPSIGAIIEMLHYKSINAQQIPTFTEQFIIMGIIPTGIVLSYCIFSLLLYLILTYCCGNNISYFQMVDPGLECYILERELWNNYQYIQYLNLIRDCRVQMKKKL